MPYSYVPDVAMTVLLPALLVMRIRVSAGRRSAGALVLFHGRTPLLVLMLTMIHIREIVQFAAYLGCFVVVAAACQSASGPISRPRVVCSCSHLSSPLIYTRWQATMRSEVSDIVDGYAANCSSTARGPFRSERWSLRLRRDTLGDFIQDFDQMFAGLTPVLPVRRAGSGALCSVSDRWSG